MLLDCKKLTFDSSHVLVVSLELKIYATDSWLSLIWPHYALYFNVARDMYEAYVLFEFFKYLTDCVDGEDNFAEKLEYIPQMRYSMPLCCFHIKPGRIFLHRCKQMILQYVYVKIVLSIATFILELLHLYAEGNFAVNRGYLWITIVYNISIFMSLYFLVLFYEGSKEILAEFSPLAKFLCIKAVIFFAFWQSVVIAILVKFNFLITARPGYTETEISAVVNNALICIEMFPIAVAFALTFSPDPFKDPARVPRPTNPGMFVNVLRNFGQVANFRDIVLDTQASLRKEPTRRIITEDFGEITMDEQKARVILEGTIKKCGEDLAKIWKTRHVALISKPAGIMYWARSPWLPSKKKAPKIRGFAQFKDIERIVVKRDTNFNVVLNTTRVWRFRCANSAERDFWVQRITAFLPKSDDTETVGLDGDNNVPLSITEEDDDEEDYYATSSGTDTGSTIGASRRAAAKAASGENGNASGSDSDSDDGGDMPLSETLDSVDRQRAAAPPPSAPAAAAAGVLNFLNRGVRRISSVVSSSTASSSKRGSSMASPQSGTSTDIDTLAGARSNAMDIRDESSEDDVSINF